VTARRAKRENGGSGGGSPRKYDDSLTGPSDVTSSRFACLTLGSKTSVPGGDPV
jgi:hypothetical protein